MTMSKKIIINESALKAIIEEEMSKAKLFNDSLHFFNEVPKDVMVFKYAGDTIRYFDFIEKVWYEDGTCESLVPDKYSFKNIYRHFYSNGWDAKRDCVGYDVVNGAEFQKNGFRFNITGYHYGVNKFKEVYSKQDLSKYLENSPSGKKITEIDMLCYFSKHDKIFN